MLAGRYGLHGRDPQTLEDLAAQLHLTRERVRQIETKAFRKLQNAVHRKAKQAGEKLAPMLDAWVQEAKAKGLPADRYVERARALRDQFAAKK